MRTSLRRKPWTKAEERILRAKYPHVQTSKLLPLLPGRTLTTIYQHAVNMGLRKTPKYLASPDACRLRRGDNVGWAHRFPKGHVPANKGLRRPGWAPGRMRETQFKKGNFSKRWDRDAYCVGALRINSDGGLDIKVKEGLRAWESLARYTWRTERGPLPAGAVIRPINGDPHDTRLKNLKLGTKASVMLENTYHRYPKEIAQLIQLRGALQRQINKREGRRA